MSDPEIFREIDEEIRREQLKALWDRFAPYIIGAAAALVLIVGGHQYWRYWQATSAAQDGARFEKAMNELRKGQTETAETLLKKLSRHGTAGYDDLARLNLAGLEAKAGKVDEAVAHFDRIAHDSSVDPVLRDYARLRAAMLRVDKADSGEMRRRLTPIIDSKTRAWRYAAIELLGASYYKDGKLDQAETLLTKVVLAADAPADLRKRVDILLQMITAAKNEQEMAAVMKPETPDGKPAKAAATN